MSVRVTVLKTSPETVVEDYARLLREADYSETIKAGRDTVLNINMPWDLWFPGCATAPWQLEGIVRTLIDDGFDAASIKPVEAGCGHGDPHKGERNNGLTVAAERAGVVITCLEGSPVGRVRYRPDADLPLLKRFCEDGIMVPDFYPGSSMIHMPTMKTSTATVFAGAMENALAGMMGENECLRLAAAESIDELIVELLAVQLEMHEGIFAVSDGVFCGDGPGPYYLRPYEKGYIAAGPDPVAVDAVTARMMGFDPMSIDHIRMAHERGLGCGDTSAIEIAYAEEDEGYAAIDFRFRGVEDGLSGVCEKAARLLPASLARICRDDLWYPWIGWGRLNRIAESVWGQRFQEYLTEDAALDRQGKGKSPLLVAVAVILLGAGAFSRMGRRV
jgi:uncharacterized protein (DUF362 family)